MGQAGDAQPNLIISYKVEWSGVVVVCGSLDCGACEMVELKRQRRVKELRRAAQTLGFRRAGCGLFRELTGEILYRAALKDKEVQETWQGNLLQLHEQATLMLRKLGRRPT